MPVCECLCVPECVLVCCVLQIGGGDDDDDTTSVMLLLVFGVWCVVYLCVVSGCVVWVGRW